MHIGIRRAIFLTVEALWKSLRIFPFEFELSILWGRYHVIRAGQAITITFPFEMYLHVLTRHVKLDIRTTNPTRKRSTSEQRVSNTHAPKDFSLMLFHENLKVRGQL